MPSSNKLAQQISALFSEKLHPQVPSLETDLIDTGLVDSLTFVEFLAQVEQEFGIQVSLEDLEIDQFRTIRGPPTSLRQRRGTAAAGAGATPLQNHRAPAAVSLYRRAFL